VVSRVSLLRWLSCAMRTKIFYYHSEIRLWLFVPPDFTFKNSACWLQSVFVFVCVCVCWAGGERVVMIFTVNSDYFPKHHWPIGFCNKFIVFLWSRNSVLEYYLQDFAAGSIDGGGHEHSQTQCVSDLKCRGNFWFAEGLLVFCRVTLRLWAITALTEWLFIKIHIQLHVSAVSSRPQAVYSCVNVNIRKLNLNFVTSVLFICYIIMFIRGGSKYHSFEMACRMM